MTAGITRLTRSADDAAKASSGFSLIEVLMVLIIIGIIIALINGLGGYARRASYEARARADIAKLHIALAHYVRTYDTYPTNLEQNALGRWLPPDFSYDDPWGRPYRLITDTNTPDAYFLFSLGADGTNGNARADADNIETGR